MMTETDTDQVHPCDSAYIAGGKAAKRGLTTPQAQWEADNKQDDGESYMYGYWAQKHREEA